MPRTNRVQDPQTDSILVGEAAAGAVAAPNPFVGINADAVFRSFAIWGRGLSRQPGEVAFLAAKLAVDTARLPSGPPLESDDRRFAHPLWQRVLPYRLLAREYLLIRAALYESVQRSGLVGDDAERARFAVALLAEAFAPSNNVLLNPAAAERAWHTRGRSLLSGAANLVDDLRHNGAMPAVSRRDAFAVGKNLACTPGEVVFRNDICELIQFRPQTPDVHAIPVLMVPSPVNKYYFLDLAPERSLVEYAVRGGIQFFTLSWRNPTNCQRDWGLDNYADAVTQALDAVNQITGSEATNLLGVCAGGLINAGVLAYQLVTSGAPIASATYLVSGIDTSWPTTFGALATTRAADYAVRKARRRGVLPGRDISRAFAWMRPNELLWGLWVNNYVMGKDAPSTDILFWNSDLTNLPARFHGEQVGLLQENPFAHADQASVLGTPVDLSKLEIDSYFLAAVDDHIVPWQACYRSAQLFGGTIRFVAASGGHIQCLVSPPTSTKARYLVGIDELAAEPRDWMINARAHTGTWWEDWLTWLTSRSGDLRPSPAELGSRRYPPLQAAPGRYVHQTV
jgi:polyhydroxyalkanoate synthase